MRCRSVSLSCKGKINHLIRLPFNKNTYLTPKPKKSSKRIKNQPSIGRFRDQSSKASISATKSAEIKQEAPKPETTKPDSKIASPSEVQEKVKQHRKSGSSNSISADTGSGGGGAEIGLEIQIANLNSSLQQLQSQLSAELDPKKQAQITIKIYRIKQQLEGLGSQLREAKRKLKLG